MNWTQCHIPATWEAKAEGSLEPWVQDQLGQYSKPTISKRNKAKQRNRNLSIQVLVKFCWNITSQLNLTGAVFRRKIWNHWRNRIGKLRFRLSRWLTEWMHLLPSLMIWVPSLDPWNPHGRREESFYHMCACACMYAKTHTVNKQNTGTHFFFLYTHWTYRFCDSMTCAVLYPTNKQAISSAVDTSKVSPNSILTIYLLTASHPNCWGLDSWVCSTPC